LLVLLNLKRAAHTGCVLQLASLSPRCELLPQDVSTIKILQATQVVVLIFG